MGNTTTFSQIASGGALNAATDKILAVRNGTTDVLVTASSGAPTPYAVNIGGTGAITAGGALDNLTGANTTGVQFLSRTGAGAYATAQQAYRVLGEYNLYDYLPNATESTIGIIQLQNWLLQAQLYALALQDFNIALDDQNLRSYIRCVLPKGNYSITSPLIIPEYVALECQGTIIRVGQVGTATNFYTGDTTSGALRNYVQPAVIVLARSHVLGTLTVYGNSNGADKGSGVALGKTWWVNAATIVAPGTGYAVNDQVQGAMPSKAPSYGFVVQVTSVNGSGGITGVAVVNRGTYPLPPILQQQQWTAANGFTGSVANGNIGAVFDPNHAGWYQTHALSGTGTGAEFTVSWLPDFAGAGATYSMGNAAIGDTLVENINVDSLGTFTDPTYGPTFGTIWGGLNFDISGLVACNGGYYGALFNGVADIHGGVFNPVNSRTGLKLVQGGSIEFTAVLDSCSYAGVEIDGTSQVFINGYAINFNQPSITGPGYIVIGGSPNGSKATGINIDMTLIGCGVTGGAIPAAYLDYMTGTNKIDLTVSNTQAGGTPVTFPIYQFAQFGTHNTSIGKITGSIDGATGSIFSGTVPNEGIAVWDATAAAWAGSSGLYSFVGSGPPTNGGAGTGANKAPPGSSYMDATNVVQYLNVNTQASPTWSAPSGTTTQKNVFQIAGTLAVANDVCNWLIMPKSGTISKAWAIAKTGPTGQAAIFDLLKSTNNGSTFTSIWNATPANKVQIAAGQVAGTQTSFDTTTFNAGDVFRIDVDQVGSGAPGANATVELSVLF